MRTRFSCKDDEPTDLTFREINDYRWFIQYDILNYWTSLAAAWVLVLGDVLKHIGLYGFSYLIIIIIFISLILIFFFIFTFISFGSLRLCCIRFVPYPRVCMWLCARSNILSFCSCREISRTPGPWLSLAHLLNAIQSMRGLDLVPSTSNHRPSTILWLFIFHLYSFNNISYPPPTQAFLHLTNLYNIYYYKLNIIIIYCVWVTGIYRYCLSKRQQHVYISSTVLTIFYFSLFIFYYFQVHDLFFSFFILVVVLFHSYYYIFKAL